MIVKIYKIQNTCMYYYVILSLSYVRFIPLLIYLATVAKILEFTIKIAKDYFSRIARTCVRKYYECFFMKQTFANRNLADRLSDSPG